MDFFNVPYNIPYEIQVNIIENLSLDDILNLHKVCLKLDIFNDNYLWSKLAYRDFNYPINKFYCLNNKAFSKYVNIKIISDEIKNNNYTKIKSWGIKAIKIAYYMKAKVLDDAIGLAILAEDINFLGELLSVKKLDLDNYIRLAIRHNKYESVRKLLLDPKSIDLNLGSYIYLAIDEGNISIVKLFLPYEDDHWRTLAKASSYGHIDVVKLLLEDKKINISSYDGAIEASCEYGRVDVTKVLISDHRVDPSKNNNYAFIAACFNGHDDIVNILLNDPRVDPSVNNNEALIGACKMKAIGEFSSLYYLGKDTSLEKSRLFSSYIKIIKLLLNDPRINPTINNNELFLSCKSPEAMKLLLDDHRMNPTFNNNELFLSCNSPEVIKLLLKHPMIDPSCNDNEALISATQWPWSDIDIVEALLKDSRVDPSARENKAIINCLNNKKNKMVKIFLQNSRFDPSSHNNNVIIKASSMGNIKIMELLLKDDRVDPSAKNNEALIKAVKKGYSDAVELLLKDERVDPSVNDNKAIRYAASNGYVDIVNILLKDYRMNQSIVNEILDILDKKLREPKNYDYSSVFFDSYTSFYPGGAIFTSRYDMFPPQRNGYTCGYDYDYD